MENKTLIFVLGLVIGAVSSAAGTYFYMTKKKNDEISELTKSYDDYIDGLAADCANCQAKQAVVEDEDIDISNEEAEAAISAYKGDVEDLSEEQVQAMIDKIDYSVFSKSKVADDELEHPEMEDKEEVTESINERPQIYPISPDDYYEDESQDRIELTYLEADDIFVTKDLEEYRAIDDIGRDNLTHLGEYEEGVLYVRNEMNGIDYEIVSDVRGYKQYVEEEYGE